MSAAAPAHVRASPLVSIRTLARLYRSRLSSAFYPYHDTITHAMDMEVPSAGRGCSVTTATSAGARAFLFVFFFVLRAAKRRDGVFVLSCPGIASVPRHGSRASVVREHEELCGTCGIETETESEGGSDGRR